MLATRSIGIVRVLLRMVSVSVFTLALPTLSITDQHKNFRSQYVWGTWSDACPCGIPCPCWEKKQSSAQFCVNFHVFYVRGGSFEGVDLADTLFVLLNLPSTPGWAPVANALFIGTSDTRKRLAVE